WIGGRIRTALAMTMAERAKPENPRTSPATKVMAASMASWFMVRSVSAVSVVTLACLPADRGQRRRGHARCGWIGARGQQDRHLGAHHDACGTAAREIN